MTSGALPPAPFGRVLTAMVTPFLDDGSVDLEGCAAVAHHLVEHGNDGVVVCGTTGESATTAGEIAQIVGAVSEAVGDRAHVVAGVGTNVTSHSVELARQVARAGADGLLVVTPYYSKPSQEGVARHLESVVAATSLPVLLYDIPGRTGVAIAEETYRRVAALEQVVAVKDAVGDLPRGVRIMEQTGLTFYSGDDALNLAWLTHGAAGVVSVVGHVAGQQYADMVAAVDRGDLTAAVATYRALLPVVDAIMGHAPGAATAKAAMQLLGVIGSRATRLPLVEADEALVARISDALTAASLLDAGPHPETSTA